jgi:hypothetical protein
MKEPKTKADQSAVKPTTLFGKLVEILGELGPIEKAKRNTHFGYNYTSEGQIMVELRHRLSSRNVFLFTSVESCQPHYGEGKEGVFVQVTTRHTFYDADTGETFAVSGAGLGWDSTDKGVYKAITGATKYALMKNFLITDEQDPEAGTEQPDHPPAKSERHGRTRPYEEETGDGDKKVATDLLELKAFLTENKIPDGFLLQLLREKDLIDGHTKNVAQLKPGVLLRCLSPKSKGNLLVAWKAYQADENSGGATAPGKSEALPKGKSEALPKGRKTAAPREFDEPVRTSEGDQTRGRRPVQRDITPSALLSQEGVANWREVKIHFGKQENEKLGSITSKSLGWWIENYKPKVFRGKWTSDDLLLDAALCMADAELGGGE